MKLLEVEVENILKVSDAKLDTSGYHLYLVGGKNGNGKTSALKAIACALCGKREMGDDWPEVLLQDGKAQGHVRLKISGDDDLHESEHLTIELSLFRKRSGVVVEEFRVLDSTGEEAPEPRTMLKRLYSMRGFDPLEFEKAKPKDRAVLLRNLVGLDFTELDEDHDKYYKRRTEINRVGKERKILLDDMKEDLGDDLASIPDKPVQVSELFEKLEDAQKQNRGVEASKLRLRELAELEAKYEKQEEDLKAKLEALDKTRQALDVEIHSQEAVVASSVIVDTTEIEDSIKQSDFVNRQVADKAEYRKLKVEVDELRSQSEACTSRLKMIKKKKEDRLEAAEFPLPELSLEGSDVLLKDLPFEQASKAERVLASVKIGMALNPKLKLLICQEGNDLDDETMSVLDKALDAGDFQLLLEYVTRSDEDESRCAVVFKDGVATNPHRPELVEEGA